MNSHGGERRRTLLLVDDEENILSSLKRLFRRENYHILTAAGGAEGLAVLAENQVDVIVSDQRMPNMTGVEFLRRAKELYPESVRIVLSGYTEFQSVTDAINEGAIYKFLSKPWDDDLLRANIAEAFRYRELVKENGRLAAELSASNQELRELLADNRRQLAREQIVLGVVQEILQVVPLPIIGFDNEGMIVCANVEAGRLLGQAGPLIGSLALEVLPPELLGMVTGNEARSIWQRGGKTWQVRYCHIGSGSGGEGRLLILSNLDEQA